MTFEEFGKLPSSPERRMLVQCLAIISANPPHHDKSLDEVFDFVVAQAEEIERGDN